MTRSSAVRLLCCGVVGWAAVASAQMQTIEISGANFRPMPLAVTAPLPQDPGAAKHASEFDAALMFDLSTAGIFQVLDRKGFLADPKEGITASTINFNRWTDVGADALVKTQLALDGDMLRADLRLFTVSMSKEELKVSHAVPVADARKLAHFFADTLYKFFTHETGPFQTHLTFARKIAKNKDVWISDWDGRAPVQVSTGGINLLPTLTRDGEAVAYTSFRSGKPDIYLQRPGGKPVPLVQAGQMATGAAFSPDGKRMAYSLANAESAQIWVGRADGTGGKQITDTPFFINTSPSWSPDGKQLAYVSNRGGSPQIYVVSAEGGPAKRLTFQGNYNQTPDWSPRGDLIAFTARDERNAFDLFTVNVDTGKVIRLTQDQGNNEEPSFSPNGRLIVFTSNRSGASQLFVMTPDGNNQTPLPVERGEYFTPAWGP